MLPPLSAPFHPLGTSSHDQQRHKCSLDRPPTNAAASHSPGRELVGKAICCRDGRGTVVDDSTFSDELHNGVAWVTPPNVKVKLSLLLLMFDLTTMQISALSVTQVLGPLAPLLQLPATSASATTCGVFLKPDLRKPLARRIAQGHSAFTSGMRILYP